MKIYISCDIEGIAGVPSWEFGSRKMMDYPVGRKYMVEELNAAYNAPPATGFDTGRMSYEGTVAKTVGLLIALFAAAAVTWLVAPGLFPIGLIVGFVLALIIIFKKYEQKEINSLFRLI